MRVKALSHVFVDRFPERLKAGELYLAMEFSTAVHLCACGCGQKVFTPFSPTDWQMLFDGETISLKPSIGNWTFPCRSHYWIRCSAIVWAGDMTEEQIKMGRLHDRRAKARRELAVSENELEASEVPNRNAVASSNKSDSGGLLYKIKSWLGL
ncbi:DUF6527 family protein [Enterobacter hormaechei]|uniref:DUF6527 family protein n=1 Tax=Enterobacteriaceae TaxID=543 RepID=UPI0010CA5366|nr:MULTISPECIES: DUF6527 family protein [Enterobacteriaceae]EKU7812472.1 hypothetical protein [Klebsiella aerogenes]BBJ57557.1 hypothetical protein EAS17NKHM_009530 [Enterobacter asburiae]HEE4157898.1 hypothetical protein [Klebsiella pneumoniae]